VIKYCISVLHPLLCNSFKSFIFWKYRKYHNILIFLKISWYFPTLVRGHSRSLKLVLFESLGTLSYSSSIVTMALSCIISEIKRDIGLKSRFLLFPIAFDAPVRRSSPPDYCDTVWCENTRMVWLSDRGKSMMTCLTVSTCERWTDR